ncbi:MAG: NDP-sugar synthase [Euryarchaeota archaeon]|nr:NDP-sugar synthase [Euryarchaeota archaeon]
MSRAHQAVILAGGKGTRLRPLTNNLPKPLLPVLGRPCVEYVIESMADAGIEEIFLTCGYRADDMVKALRSGNQLGVNIVMCVEESPAGTAGAVKLLEDRLEDTFIVASGDVLADVNIHSLIKLHDDTGAMATMALAAVDRPEEFGIVGLDNRGRIERFKEKPRTEEIFSNLVNAGIYVLERDVLLEMPEGEMYDFSKQLFPKLLDAGQALYGSLLDGLWKDIGRPQDLLDANIQMADRKGSILSHDTAETSGKIVATSFSAKDCKIDGPTYIGKDVSLGHESKLHSSAIGDATIVGEGSELSNSFVMNDCVIGSQCQVIGSLLGNDVIIGKGAILHNCILGDGVRVDAGIKLLDQILE